MTLKGHSSYCKRLRNTPVFCKYH